MIDIEKTRLFQLAFSACDNKNYKIGIQYYDDLEKMYPNAMILFNNRGRAKVNLGIDDKSLIYLTAGIKDLIKANSFSQNEEGEAFINLSLEFAMEELRKLLDEYFKNFPDLTYTVSVGDEQELDLVVESKDGIDITEKYCECMKIVTDLQAQGIKYISGKVT